MIAFMYMYSTCKYTVHVYVQSCDTCMYCTCDSSVGFSTKSIPSYLPPTLHVNIVMGYMCSY